MLLKRALKKHIRFTGEKGNIQTEDLYELKLEQLDAIAMKLDKELSESTGKSFIGKKSDTNKLTQLKLDVVLEVIKDKLAEQAASDLKKQRKEKREEIMAVIAEKEKTQREGKSLKSLYAELEKLEEPIEDED